MSDLHLTAHLGHGHQTIGKPGKHTGYTHTGHGTAAETADPDHIDKIVGHLYKISHDNRKRQYTKRAHDPAMQKINCFCHKTSQILREYKVISLKRYQ